MLLMMLERNEFIHSVIWFDTGWEFPQMYKHIKKIEEYTKIKIVKLKPEKSFDYWMCERPIKAIKEKNKALPQRIGCGWPSPMRRWCTRLKTNAIDRYTKTIESPINCIGFASDEWYRCNSRNLSRIKVRFPLIEWGITEKDALQYCYSKGFYWSGLYKNFDRVSCFCCPLQKISKLRTLRREYPELWDKMLEMDSKIPSHNRGFRGYKTVHDLERRFLFEDKQLNLFDLKYL